MNTHTHLLRKLLPIIFVSIGFSASAQDSIMQYYRPNDKLGVNVFETSKKDDIPFTGTKVKVGGNFEMEFQTLRDKNTAIPTTAGGSTTGVTAATNVNSLIKLANGFDLPMANMNIDAQLSDGIRMNLSLYLSARHHEETWVKGGYIQFDKLLFLHSKLVDNIMKKVTIRVGQYDVDYGDQHYRRSDGGNTIYNPFVENYIMDEFATEIGAAFYYHCPSGLFAMAGITDGELNQSTLAATKIDSATGQVNAYDPAFQVKLGFDKQINKDFRFRLTGSYYGDKSANSLTLFGGDRTGSHYYGIMSNQNAANSAVLSNANDYNPFVGRLNPGFSEQISTFMINPFLKYKGLEFFGTYESAQGRSIKEKTERKATQVAADLIYRFAAGNENFWIGFRYNTVKATLLGIANDVTINREVGSVGWFLTKNVMLKAEYVNQEYVNYPNTNILNGGQFNGLVFEASIAF